MLSKINRLKKKKDFERVFKKGKGLRGDFLILRAAENKLGINRFGFVISKKVSKKAVTRNKIRRRLGVLIKERLPGIRGGIDVILVVAPGAANKSFPEFGEAIDKIFKKAGIINKG